MANNLNIFRNVIITELIIFSFVACITIVGYIYFIKKLKEEKVVPIIFMIFFGFIFSLAFRDIGMSLPLEIYDYSSKQYIETEGKVEEIEWDSRNMYVYMNNEKYVLPRAIEYDISINDNINIKYGRFSKYIVYIETVE